MSAIDEFTIADLEGRRTVARFGRSAARSKNLPFKVSLLCLSTALCVALRSAVLARRLGLRFMLPPLRLVTMLDEVFDGIVVVMFDETVFEVLDGIVGEGPDEEGGLIAEAGGVSGALFGLLELALVVLLPGEVGPAPVLVEFAVTFAMALALALVLLLLLPLLLAEFRLLPLLME